MAAKQMVISAEKTERIRAISAILQKGKGKRTFHEYLRRTTKDGRFLIGKIVDRSGSTITFRPMGGRA